MLELLNRIPLVVQVVLVVVFVLICTTLAAYLIFVLVDGINGHRARVRREQQEIFTSLLRIARGCERIGDILASTDFLVTVEETEERIIPYD